MAKKPEDKKYLASSSDEIGIPFLRHVTSIGWSPLASQISEALSPFLTESRTDFSLKCGGAEEEEERQFMRFGMLHGLSCIECANANGEKDLLCCLSPF